MQIHVVKKGDTVWSVARRYGVSPQRIIADNGLSGQPYLVVGQALIILIPETVHTVDRGESLESIAGIYGVPVPSLLQKNPELIPTRQVHPRQNIVIFFQGEEQYPAAFNGYGYSHIKEGVLRRALPYLTDFTIFGYGFTTSGDLIPVEDEKLIALSYQYSTAPILLLSSITEDGNFSGERASRLFHDRELQDTVIANLLAVMKEKGYLGLDVDFEYVNAEDSEAFLSFLENVTAQMHANGYRVNVDLAPKTSAEQKGLLYEAHNYAAIGAIADTVLLMTYEWGYTYGPPMAVAPLPSVRQVVAYAATEIPTEKIMLGIPNYGYDWKLPYEKGKTRATSIGNEAAVRIAAEHGAEIQYDTASQSPFFEYWGQEGSKHVVWFEDVRSIQGKFDLITEFSLRGGGYWNLMRPFSQNWALLGWKFWVKKVVE